MVTKHPSPPKIIHAIEKFSWQNPRTPFCHQASCYIYVAIIFSRWCLLQFLRGAIDGTTTEVALCNHISTWSFRTIFFKSWLKVEYVLFPLAFAFKFFFWVNYHWRGKNWHDRLFLCWAWRILAHELTVGKPKAQQKPWLEILATHAWILVESQRK